MSTSRTEPPASEQSSVTRDVLQRTATRIGVHIPSEKEAEFTDLLASAREAMVQVLAMDDYYPVTDIKKYPRTSVASVSPIDNEYNAWATKATVKTTDKEEAEHGLLAGKRVVLKDNVCLAGVPCHFGTDVFTDWVPKTDATVVTRILKAGGTATCESFSAFGISNTSALGPVGNLYDKTRSAGGSSSGCGVLIALGEADLAIGGDQGGSIRLTWNTLPFNNTGHPALTIPCGMLSPPEGPNDLRLPIGMQLVGRFWEELTLYKAALAWSDAFKWKEM
ncbi:hypothetical protein FOMPIDRAFT_1119784 [Fomitopsis schrenkii]|uniref:Amidase domain-containing protein n=1 Tax=Fomitopsis schrenkii TaxID=2126942 RepID=S8EAL6_FOMSC|nr:hypothetical protein FOMPIDRAFT_1119784 [Fomitopsis schrenkii]